MIFVEKGAFRFNLQDMRVLCLTCETDLLAKVSTVFADQINTLDTVTDPGQFLAAANSSSADVFMIDYDQIHLVYPNPVDLVKKMPPHSPTLVIGSSSFADWHQPLRNAGALILHKPVTVGEIGLALRRLITEAGKRPRK